MEKSRTEMGKNKTGVQMSPQDIDRMMHDVEQSATGAHDGAAIAAVRTSYITEAEPLGTVPPPGSLKGVAKTAMQKIRGKNPEVFIDKLGERLAFERTGVRLYETLITKCQSSTAKGPSSMSIDQLTHFRDEEAQHFKWLADAMAAVGADSTAETPGADVVGVEATGLLHVLQDPRTTVPQSLNALLVAELADRDGWDLLIKLAEDAGQEQMASNFRKALQQEDEHLDHVRRWVEQSVREAAT